MRALAIIATSLLLVACGGPDGGPEAMLRQWVAEAEAAAEQKDRRSLMTLISVNYQDARGNDHDAIEALLRYYFLRQQTVNLATSVDEITINGETAADVFITVGLVGLDDSTLGINADAFRFHLEMEHHDDDWLLMSARWAELGQELR